MARRGKARSGPVAAVADEDDRVDAISMSQVRFSRPRVHGAAHIDAEIRRAAELMGVDVEVVGGVPAEGWANAATMHEARKAEMTPKIHAAASRAADRIAEILERQGLPLTVTYEIT